MTDARTFAETQWLATAGQPIDEPGVRQVATPAEFFEAIYATDFQSWKLEDHQDAESLDEDNREWVGAVAGAAFEAAFERYPEPEACALLSDDVHTILSLLLLDAPLRPQTRERMEWYVRGRFPCGYDGDFPGGTWLVR